MSHAQAVSIPHALPPLWTTDQPIFLLHVYSYCGWRGCTRTAKPHTKVPADLTSSLGVALRLNCAISQATNGLVVLIWQASNGQSDDALQALLMAW